MTTHDMGKHLFVDDEEIHQTFGTWRVLNQPTKLPGPLITSGEPGRGNPGRWGGVLHLRKDAPVELPDAPSPVRKMMLSREPRCS